MELSESQLERLALVNEEAAEVQQMISKIIRHGYASTNPFDETNTSNRKLLEKELGDLIFTINLLIDSEDVSGTRITEAKESKKKRINQYLHFNSVKQ